MKSLLLLALVIFAMNDTFAQPVIKVRGSEDSVAHLSQIIKCLDYLDIRENICLNVYFSSHLSNQLDGTTYVQPAPALNGRQLVKVIVIRIASSLTKEKQSLVLAHEMIHVGQIIRGELEFDKQQVIWKGRKYLDRLLEPRRTPWELEAYRQDRALAAISTLPTVTLPMASHTAY